MNAEQKYMWVDIETNGLDETKGTIFEIALVATDGAYNELARFETVFPINVDGWEMSPEVREMHTSSGLLDECRKAFQADIHSYPRRLFATKQFVKDHGGERPIMCGSTISFDRRWISALWQGFFDGWHYRMIDVSSTREQLRGIGIQCPERVKDCPKCISPVVVTNPDGSQGPVGKGQSFDPPCTTCKGTGVVPDKPHRAMADILASITLGRWENRGMLTGKWDHSLEV